MNETKGIREENSVPVESRISIRRLAELDIYWEREGYQIRTMSQLVAWSMELLCTVLEANEKAVEIETIREAYERLVIRGLKVKKAGFMKMGAMLRFESMREEGLNPVEYAGAQYAVVNRRNTMSPMPGEAKAVYVSPFEEDYRKAQILKEQEEQDRRNKEVENAVKDRKDRGILAEEVNKKNRLENIPDNKASANLTEWEREKRERDYLKALNAPVDEQIEFMKKNMVK